MSELIKGNFYSAQVRNSGRYYLVIYVHSICRKTDGALIHKVLVIMESMKFFDWFEKLEDIQLYLSEKYGDQVDRIKAI